MMSSISRHAMGWRARLRADAKYAWRAGGRQRASLTIATFAESTRSESLKSRPSDDAAMPVAAFDVVKRNLAAGDGDVDAIIKVKVGEPATHVELGARYVGYGGEVRGV